MKKSLHFSFLLGLTLFFFQVTIAQSTFGPANLDRNGLNNDGNFRIVPSSYYSPVTGASNTPNWSWCTTYSPAKPFPGSNATPGFGGMTSWNSSSYKAFSFQRVNINFSYDQMNMRLLVPPGYNQLSTKKYPLIVFLHGAGESGGRYASCDVRNLNNDHQLLWGGQSHMNTVLASDITYDAFVLYAQNDDYNGAWAPGSAYPNGTQNYVYDGNPVPAINATNTLIQVIEYFLAGGATTNNLKLNIDPNRVYVEGLSNGGGGTWDVLMRRPDLFAGAIPMSSGGPTLQPERLNYVGIWYWQGGKDTNPVPSSGRAGIEALQAVSGIRRDKKSVDITSGGPINGTAYNTYIGNKRYIEESNEGHGVFTDNYSHPDFWRWLFSQSKLNIVPFGDTTLTAGNSVTIGVQNGYAGYDWQYSTDNISYSSVLPNGLLNGSNKLVVPVAGYFRVRLNRVNLGWSEYSQPIRIIAPGLDTQPPTTPTGLTATSITQTGFTLNWNASTDNVKVTGYNVFRNGVKQNTSPVTGTTFSLSSLTPATLYTMTVMAFDASGNTSPASASLGVTTTGQVQTGIGTGLKGDYFNNMTLTGTPALTRTDATVNFNWGSTAPATAIGVDKFSVRWTGQVEAPVAGTFNFAVTADDGVRLFINGIQLVNAWKNQGATRYAGSQSFTLTAGQKVNIRMEYYENTGSAVARLLWSYPGQAEQAIPKNYLYPTTNSQLPLRELETVSQKAVLKTSNIASSLQSLLLAPNPTQSIASGNFTATKVGNLQIRIIDALGRQVKQSEQKLAIGENHIEVDVSTYPSGMYFIYVTDGKNKSVQRLAVSR